MERLVAARGMLTHAVRIDGGRIRYAERVRRFVATVIAIPALLVGAAAVAQPAGPPPGEPVTPRAGFVLLSPEDVPVTVSLPGRVSARESAAIRPLVDGVVKEVLYEAGRPVAVGTPLFSIDPRSYEAALVSARAALQSAEAALPAAQANVTRYESLVGAGVTQETLETARVNLAQATATIAQAEAAVLVAEINLERTTITSPFDGIPDIAAVSVGDLVTSGQATALTTVTSLDPIYVDISEASGRMLALRARIDSGEMRPGANLGVALTLENGARYSGVGTLSSISSEVSTSTGTVRIRIQFENPDRLILPGMFVRATLTMGTMEAVLVPQLAATLQADGSLSIWVLDEEDRARELRVTAIGSTDRAWIISEGIEGGARLLVDNIDSMVEGTEVTPVAVSISDEGVIADAAEAGTPAPGGN